MTDLIIGALIVLMIVAAVVWAFSSGFLALIAKWTPEHKRSEKQRKRLEDAWRYPPDTQP